MLKTIQIPHMDVKDIVSTGKGDISILHKEGICRQYVDQLINGVPFK
jgi:hypothetical protein